MRSPAAWLRWLLGPLLNTYSPSIHPCTLAAKLVGGYVIGAAIAFFSQAPGIAEVRRYFGASCEAIHWAVLISSVASFADLCWPSQPAMNGATTANTSVFARLDGNCIDKGLNVF